MAFAKDQGITGITATVVEDEASSQDIVVPRQTRRVRRNLLSGIDSLVRLLEERDPCTAGHSRRVQQYALALARAAGCDRRVLRQVRLAAALHDIGKAGVPEALLHKPGPLSPEEEKVVREHAVIGERILKPIIRQPEILAAIRGHHERLDGSGYPDGLCGTQIPLLARLIAIPDCFDALVMSRAYRDALPIEAAHAILADGAGRHFDPGLVRLFVQMAPHVDLCGVEENAGE